MKSFVLCLMLATTMVACKKKYTQADLDAANASGNSAGYSTGYSAGNTSGQDTAETRAVKAANLAFTMQKQFGSGYTFELLKFGQTDANYAVFKSSGSENLIFAIDISAYTKGTNYTNYTSTHSSYFYLTDMGDGTYRCAASCFASGGATVNPNMIFEKSSSSVKDLEKAAALAEAMNVETMSSNIAAEFGLSDERAVKVAKLATSWSKLSKSRALTNADADAFSKELAGVTIVDMENAYKALTEGSSSEMDAVLEKAAEVNGTSSENMSVIMTKLFM